VLYTWEEKSNDGAKNKPCSAVTAYFGSVIAQLFTRRATYGGATILARFCGRFTSTATLRFFSRGIAGVQEKSRLSSLSFVLLIQQAAASSSSSAAAAAAHPGIDH